MADVTLPPEEPTRWLVERMSNAYDEVNGYLTLHVSGALMFGESRYGAPNQIIARGEWITVVERED